MIKFEEININSLKDFDKLKSLTVKKGTHSLLPIGNEYIDDVAISMIKELVGTVCKRVIVEFPYYDKDYLSTYYIYYSKKLKKYDKRNWRLIFLGKNYKLIGYTTLRPTTDGTKIGKTYIDPHFIIKKDENISTHMILSKQKAHIFNKEVFIPCFPWMCQQKDITVCAHIALWSLMRTLTAKTSIYAETSLGKIAEQVEYYSQKLHANGLTPQQISTILMNNKMATTIQHLEEFYIHYAEMVAYVDSGFAFIGVLSNYTHAVVVIGYNIDKSPIRMNVKDNTLDKINKFIENHCIKITDNGDIIYKSNTTEKVQVKIVLHSEFVKSLIVNDDQCIPYQFVSKYPPSIFVDKKDVGESNTKSDYIPNYLATEIDNIVVPFYNRIQLSYQDVMAKMYALLSSKEYKWIEGNDSEHDVLFIRIFLALSNTYKEYAISEWEKEENAAAVCYSIESPKYFWCIEVSNRENYSENKVNSIILIDSTVSPSDTRPFLFIKDMDKCQYFDENEKKEVKINKEALPCFKGGTERI